MPVEYINKGLLKVQDITDSSSLTTGSVTTTGGIGVAKSGRFGGPVVFSSYAKASLPTASSYTGGMVYVTDDAGGAVPAFSDGTNWRRVTDRAIIA
jgi:hypothetical protein